MIFTTDNRAAADLGKTNIYWIIEIFGRKIVFFFIFFFGIFGSVPRFFFQGNAKGDQWMQSNLWKCPFKYFEFVSNALTSVSHVLAVFHAKV